MGKSSEIKKKKNRVRFQTCCSGTVVGATGRTFRACVSGRSSGREGMDGTAADVQIEYSVRRYAPARKAVPSTHAFTHTKCAHARFSVRACVRAFALGIACACVCTHNTLRDGVHCVRVDGPIIHLIRRRRDQSRSSGRGAP